MNVRRKTLTTDSKSVILLIIDPQVDFHEGGTLAVTGATADSKRIAAMITLVYMKLTINSLTI